MIGDREVGVRRKNLGDGLEQTPGKHRRSEIAHVMREDAIERTDLIKSESNFDAFLSRPLDLAAQLGRQ